MLGTLLSQILIASCLIRLSPAEESRIVTIQELQWFKDETRQITFDEIGKDPSQRMSHQNIRWF